MTHIEKSNSTQETTAETCPHCGNRLSEEGEWATAVTVVLIAIGLFVLAGLSLLGVIG